MLSDFAKESFELDAGQDRGRSSTQIKRLHLRIAEARCEHVHLLRERPQIEIHAAVGAGDHVCLVGTEGAAHFAERQMKVEIEFGNCA
jgi:hypothetical protein